ncbi:MAG: choice-of-anchor Q domain-containing protein [Prolixibacteraceae bacterium]|jgi:hypothetical protein|nr:choice-of-anchor Q domain-containing protein [Prolixibacteraceae bacterium]
MNKFLHIAKRGTGWTETRIVPPKKTFIFPFLFFFSVALYGQDYGGGDGSSGNPYQISSVADLADLAVAVNAGTHYSGVYFKQMDDVDLNVAPYNAGAGWTPIGYIVGDPGHEDNRPFKGNYNGDNKTISNLYVNNPDGIAGLFGMTQEATISNLNLTGVNITGKYAAGALAAYHFGASVTSCSSSGTVASENNAGGLLGVAGYFGTTIQYCSSSCTVTGTGEYAGGLVGDHSSSAMSYCFSTGNVSGASRVGGLAGSSYSATITNCYATGNVTGTVEKIGGLTGDNSTNASTSNCFSKGLVTASGASLYGGLNGFIWEGSTVTNCFWDTQTSGQSASDGGTGKTTAEMQGFGTFYLSGWDFKGESANGTGEIWNIGNSRNDGYPYLSWQYPDDTGYTPPIFVDASASGSNNGANWTNAYTSLQTAITAATSGTQIWVVAETYKPTTSTDRGISFTLKNGVAIYGGFAGTETLPDQRDWEANVTILSGDIGTVDSSSDNSYHVIDTWSLDNTAILDGFTITKGNANGASYYAYGGGIYNDESSPSITHCMITGNSAEQGGGLYNTGSSSPDLTSCTISGNSASSEGGGVYNTGSSPTLVNCLITDNSAYNGGGLFNMSSSSPTLTNCTVSGNTSTGGGGMYNQSSSSPTLNNSIIWGNSATGLGKQIYINSAGATLNYSCYSNGTNDVYGTITATNNNITSNPVFVNPNSDFRLTGSSPCLDTGNDAYNAETNDIRGSGFGRKLLKTDAGQTGTIDMGAYEYKYGTDEAEPDLLRLYVKSNATGANNGTSWANAYTSLQSALNAGRYYEIWVAAGTYKPTTGSDRSISFKLESNMAVYGGFAGTETSLGQRDWIENPTILSGDIGTVDSSSDNSYHVVYTQTERNDPTAILDGFTIENGNANGSYPDDSGGGVYNYNSSGAVITNCTITGNSASNYGGGVYNGSSSSTSLTNCVISDNSALEGGGVCNYTASSSVSLINCLIYGNSATSGGGLYNVLNSKTYNSIIWGNSATSGKQIYVHAGTTNLYYSCYSYGTGDVYNEGTFTPDAHCTTTDPKFVNASGGDFRLYENSPCVNTGYNGYNTTDYDIRKETRIQNTTIDMGAYEWTEGVDPATPTYTWTGTSSTDWNTAGNWDLNAVPTADDHATIPDVANDPVIGSAAACKDLTIQTGGNLTVNNGYTLSVGGNLSLKSEASKAASLINNGTINVTGTTYAESYLTGNQWHVVSPVVSGGAISSFLVDGDNAIPTKESSYGMMDYDEATNDWNSYFTSSTEGNLTAGKGYGLRRSSDGTVTYTGTLTSGSKTVALTKGGTEGWNCIGNPYPSSIFITDAGNAENNFLKNNSGSLDESYACIYVWNDASSGYKIQGNASGWWDDRTLGQNLFSSGQGFFVKAKNAGSVTFNSAMQTHNYIALKSAATPWPGFKLVASSAQGEASAIVVFNSKMTAGLDITYDAGLLRGTTGQELYTRLVNDNGVDFAIQCLPENYSSLVIPVGAEFKEGGEITFSAQTVGLPATCSVILEDKTAQTLTDLTSGASYKAVISAGKTDIGRFYIHTSYSTTGALSPLEDEMDKLKAYPANGRIWIIGKAGPAARVQLYNMNGQIRGTYNLQEGRRNSIPATGLVPGVYLLRLIEGNKHSNLKVLIHSN